MILIIDNYDSFTYLYYQYVSEISGQACRVVRNDQVSVEEIDSKNVSHIIISPGPCTTNEAGVSMDVIRALGSRIPILGICLGYQAIGQVFGASVICAEKPVHGKVSNIYHNNGGSMRGLPCPFKATRYHSLILDRVSIPDELIITAETSDGIVMGVKHKQYPIEGVQFHPESIMTTEGKKLLINFLNENEQ